MTTQLWIAGWNLGGYLPEMAPYLTTDWESARNFIADEIVSYRDSLYDALTTHKYFGSGRENWTAQQLLDFAEQYEDGFPCYVMDGQWETVFLTNRDKATLTEFQQCTDALVSLGLLEDNEEWAHGIKYLNYWINAAVRSDHGIPEDLEGDELEEMVQQLNDLF